MRDTANDSERILAAARSVLAGQRAGGRRMTGRADARQWPTIRRARRRRQVARIVALILLALVALNLAITVLTAVFGALIGVATALLGPLVLGLMVLMGVGAIGAGVLWLGPGRTRPLPTLDTLRVAPLDRVVNETQRWLEAQRRALPSPAAQTVDLIGARLDTLSAQLAAAEDPALAGDIRRLVGEHLPGVVSAYTSVPPALRGDAHAGTSPDVQLAASLATIDGEIEALNRRLASGALDRLAIESRYLDMRYRDGESDPA